ncbi:MAG TPA: DoxX family protein [Ferruginibacter sp.]|nr:DoxX family protein [Ferruginibacter sp.]
MRKLFSAKYSAGAVSAAMLILRFGVGILMLNHGYQKLINFSELEPKFINFMGMGTTVSLALLVFAEFFCSIFLILGLFTRLATIPLIIATCVMIFKAHNGDVLGEAQIPTLFLIGYLVLLFVGPGKASVDGMIGK